MDPITTAILAGIAAGATKVGESVLVDAYNKVKGILSRTFGDDSAVSKAVAAVEEKPESKGRAEVLAEEVKAAKADENADLLEAAKVLQDKVNALPNAAQLMQHVSGHFNATAGQNSTASVTINLPKSQ